MVSKISSNRGMYSIASFSSFECLDFDLGVRVRFRVWVRLRVRVLVRVEGFDLRVRVRDGGIGACLVLAEENRKRKKVVVVQSFQLAAAAATVGLDPECVRFIVSIGTNLPHWSIPISSWS